MSKNLTSVVLFAETKKKDMDLYFAGGADPLSWPEKAERQFGMQIFEWADLDNDKRMNMVRVCRICAHICHLYVHYIHISCAHLYFCTLFKYCGVTWTKLQEEHAHTHTLSFSFSLSYVSLEIGFKVNIHLGFALL